jgi:hypothetical protein
MSENEILQEAEKLLRGGATPQARQLLASVLRTGGSPALWAFYDRHFPLARPCQARLRALEACHDPSAVAAALRKLDRTSDPRFILPVVRASHWLCTTGFTTLGLWTRVCGWLPPAWRSELEPVLKILEALGTQREAEELRRALRPH